MCDACVQRASEAVEPPPFEDARLPPARRFFATLKAAFFPRASAPSFARARPDYALLFLLLTVLPASALAGVIPFTKTLLFGPGLDLRLVGEPGRAEVVFDVARAMLVQLALDFTTLLALGLPFVTLARSYGRPGAMGAAGCMFLYRAWLLPAASLSAYAVFWVTPSPELASVLSLTVYAPAMILLVYAMWFTARRAGEIEWTMALAVCGVPWVLAILVSGVVGPTLISIFGVTPDGFDPGNGIRI